MNPERHVQRVSQRRGKGFFLFKPVSIVSTSLDQESILTMLQPDVWVDDEEKTTTKTQAAAPKELRDCRLTGNNERLFRPSKASTLTLEGDGKSLPSVETDVFSAVLYFARMSRIFLLCISLVCNFPKQVQDKR